MRVVYEHTRQLAARGHQVRLVVPELRPGPPWSAAGRGAWRKWIVDRFIERGERALRFYGLADRVVRVPRLDPRHFPDGHVTLATSWVTAAPVAAAPPRCGRGAYFLQHHEVFTPGIEEDVDATWRLPLERIVIATWLARLARERFGVPAWGPVVNGVNQDLFHARGRRENEPPVLGMVYERQAWKGLEDGFAAVDVARRTVPGLRLRLFGKPRLRHALRPDDGYERNPPQERLAAIYRECDLFLSPSWTEGCQLPPMEAMASGCAVVATAVGGIPDYAVAGETVLTAPPREPETLGRQLARLAADRELRRRIAEAGQRHIARFTWEAASTQLEQCLFAIVGGANAPAVPVGGASPQGGAP